MKVFLKPRLRRNTETWHVVYIDLMTNLMVVFVILWSIQQGSPVRFSTRIGETVSRMLNLPGDVIFAPGKMSLSADGKSVFNKLFDINQTGQALSFDDGGFTKRYLVIHGHTDGDGEKEKNFELGFGRAMEAYHEIKRYSREVADHVVLCTHADNSPLQEVPKSDAGTSIPPDVLRLIKAKNRRITIENKVDGRVQVE